MKRYHKIQNELKPCPWCNQKPVFRKSGILGCKNFHAGIGGFDKKLQIKLWNSAYCWKKIDALKNALEYWTKKVLPSRNDHKNTASRR